MADDSKQQIPNIGSNGFIWMLLVAAAGTYFVVHQVPLEGSRPPANDKSRLEQTDVQGIDARLWQDPFAAVTEKVTGSQELQAKSCPDKGLPAAPEAAAWLAAHKPHCVSPLAGTKPDGLLVLVVPVSAAPYSEDHEARRRTRYAVLAGLNAEGYVPKDPQHIGFYWSHVDQSPQADPSLQASQLLSHVQLPQAVQSPQAPRIPIPYEWFKPVPERKNPSYSSILLLWLDEDRLGNSPLKQFSELLCPSPSNSRTTARRAKTRILGAQTSTTLQAMVDEVNRGDWSKEEWLKGPCRDVAPPPFYIYSATADDTTLIPGDLPALSIPNPPHGSSCLDSDTCLSGFFEKKGIALHRMIATDEALVRTIRDELKLRGIDNVEHYGRRSHIALVSEWDTVYGRALPATVARCLSFAECQQPSALLPGWLHPFKYMRGLDGQLADAGGRKTESGSDDTGSKQDNNAAKNDTRIRPDPAARDRAEGQGQYDYLRRLGERIQQLDADLQREGEGGIQAVGVLGSDVYDKLLVLQALKPLFPHALFFTTDLDAVLLHPTVLTPTRNLLVASNFGLQLRPDIQGGIPPFRDNYQTARFLATRVAIRSDAGPPPWLMQPLLFEVGASRPIQFPSRVASKPAATEAERSDHERCASNLLECDELQPLASAMFPPFNRAWPSLAPFLFWASR